MAGPAVDELTAFITDCLNDDRRELVNDPPKGMGSANLPGRMLREIEAKQALLARHTCNPNDSWRPDSGQPPRYFYCDCQVDDGIIEGEWPCETVKSLAWPYKDLPRWKEEWRPENIGSGQS